MPAAVDSEANSGPCCACAAVHNPPSVSPKHRAALRVGLARSRVRILGSVLKSESAPKQALESVSRGSWHCVAKHFENAPQRNAQLPGRPMIRPVSEHFMISRPSPKPEPDFLLTRLLGLPENTTHKWLPEGSHGNANLICLFAPKT